MKKILFIALLSSSFSIFCMPAEPEEILEALKTNKQYLNLTQKNGFKLLSAKVLVEKDENIIELCDEYSRSASFAEVIIENRKTGQKEHYYFSTSERPEDLMLCN